MKKLVLSLLLGIGFFFGISFAEGIVNVADYRYFHAQGCSHCLRVEQFFAKTDVDEKIGLQSYEIMTNSEGRQLFLDLVEELGLALDEVGTPFLIVKSPEGKRYYTAGDLPIIQHFQELEKDLNAGKETLSLLNLQEGKEQAGNKKPLLVLIFSGALADSINPCAFAVMLLLLSTILSRSKSRIRTLLSGLLFSFAIFVSYYLLGMGVLTFLGDAENVVVLKWGVGIFGLLLAIANIKDYFWYGKGFVMEVPLAWRPKMMKLIQGVVSPVGAFLIGILVSLFLLPCSAGPYVAVLGYLGSEGQNLNLLGHLYLLLYNFIFVLPMLLITILVSFGVSSVEKLAKLKHKHTRLIHLLVGLLMLALSVYVIGSLYWWK